MLNALGYSAGVNARDAYLGELVRLPRGKCQIDCEPRSQMSLCGSQIHTGYISYALIVNLAQIPMRGFLPLKRAGLKRYAGCFKNP